MKRMCIASCCAILLLFVCGLSIQAADEKKYEANWESLDKRPMPEWYPDAKFGIFIHWGTYSVPSWGERDQYAEWYWNYAFEADGKTLKNNTWGNFHKKNYGADFPYQNFAAMFKAELFNPEEWADIFQRSGAKYIALTSKHHEGFCLWPNEQASKTWGRPWNSVETGPHRDLAGDLTQAVRAKGLKMGFYYSLYEWFNPLWLTDKKRYVDEHMTPQFKDLVTKYKPSIIFSDGEWDLPSSEWKSPELLAWLFNESPCRDEVVVDDRWGKDTRHKHGSYYTTEYGAGLPDAKNFWEENRGMGFSYGFNRNEPLSNYRTGHELVWMFADLVSRGGNLLLNIGPTGDGRIPVIMQDRLLYLGDWLKVNGEAIYGTRTWKKTNQWTPGEMPKQEHGEFKVKYSILETAGLKPRADKDGKQWAVKNVFFTFKPKEKTLFAITPGWPKNELALEGVKATPDKTVVTLLGRDGEMKWETRDGNLVIQVPPLTVDELPCRDAFAFKITNVE